MILSDRVAERSFLAGALPVHFCRLRLLQYFLNKKPVYFKTNLIYKVSHLLYLLFALPFLFYFLLSIKGVGLLFFFYVWFCYCYTVRCSAAEIFENLVYFSLLLLLCNFQAFFLSLTLITFFNDYYLFLTLITFF